MSYGVLGALLVWAAVVVFRRRQEERVTSGRQSPAHSTKSPSPRAVDPDIDQAALEEAEREVRDLETDVRGRPLDDAVGDDWGPGTPKPPYV